MVNYIIIQDLLESFNQSFSNGDCAIISQSEAILLESSTHLKQLYELNVCISLQFDNVISMHQSEIQLLINQWLIPIAEFGNNFKYN